MGGSLSSNPRQLQSAVPLRYLLTECSHSNKKYYYYYYYITAASCYTVDTISCAVAFQTIMICVFSFLHRFLHFLPSYLWARSYLFICRWPVIYPVNPIEILWICLYCFSLFMSTDSCINSRSFPYFVISYSSCLVSLNYLQYFFVLISYYMCQSFLLWFCALYVMFIHYNSSFSCVIYSILDISSWLPLFFITFILRYLYILFHIISKLLWKSLF